MQTTKQTFPAVNIEALPNGLLRLEDETSMEGLMVIDLHPAQVQVLASMTGFKMPNKTSAALARMSRRLHALHKQAQELKGQLTTCVVDQGIHVAPELTAAEFIAFGLGELVEDLDAIQTPDLESIPDAQAHPGGQMTIPI